MKTSRINPEYLRRAQSSLRHSLVHYTTQLFQYVYASRYSALDRTLRSQGSVVVRANDHRSESLNRAREELISRLFVLQQRRQHAFERYTRRELSEFELMSEFSSPAISDSLSSAQKARHQRSEREGRMNDVPKTMTSVYPI